ncbi:SEC-C metal-binding domain-containing protein [Halobacillus locisalis]|uniref:SEC-C metal-binding domain-containing protein n=1 Tax=Halobacillus locisalis TaxID=220753 RepID=UPI001FE6E72A|nr:SEC-C metal-binding domain-containing protein [Halobacillus locisalis]
MSKVGRNEPCPCGSGKKYKKCCGNSKVIEFPSVTIKEELDRAFQRFQDHIVNHYAELLPTSKPQSQEEHLGQFFSLLQGSVFDKQEDGTTIMDDFVEQEKEKVSRPLSKESLVAWTDAAAGVFALDDHEDAVIVKSVFDDSTFSIVKESIPLEDIASAPYYFGVLMKWGDVHQFMPIAIPQDEERFKAYMEKLSDEQKTEEYFTAHLAEQFRMWVRQETGEREWDARPEDKEVLDLFEETVEDDVVGKKAYDRVRNAWGNFCETEVPTIRKAGVFAAALEFMASENVTKKQIAEKYSVSPSSMTRRIKEIEVYM